MQFSLWTHTLPLMLAVFAINGLTFFYIKTCFYTNKTTFCWKEILNKDIKCWCLKQNPCYKKDELILKNTTKYLDIFLTLYIDCNYSGIKEK